MKNYITLEDWNDKHLKQGNIVYDVQTILRNIEVNVKYGDKYLSTLPIDSEFYIKTGKYFTSNTYLGDEIDNYGESFKRNFEFTSSIFGPIYVYLKVYATMIDDKSSKFGHYLMFNYYIDKFYIIDEDMREIDSRGPELYNLEGVMYMLNGIVDKFEEINVLTR